MKVKPWKQNSFSGRECQSTRNLPKFVALMSLSNTAYLERLKANWSTCIHAQSDITSLMPLCKETKSRLLWLNWLTLFSSFCHRLMSQGKKYHKTCFLSAKFIQKGVGWLWKRITNERFLHLLKSSTYHLQWGRTDKVEVELSYFFKLDTRYGRLVKATFRSLYPLERDPVAIFAGDWVGLGTSLDRCGKCFPTGVQTPKPPVRSE